MATNRKSLWMLYRSSRMLDGYM